MKKELKLFQYIILKYISQKYENHELDSTPELDSEPELDLNPVLDANLELDINPELEIEINWRLP